MTKLTYKVGQKIATRYGDAIIRRVYPLGTVDVENVATGRWYRVTGLPLYAPEGGWGAAVLSAGAL